MKLSPPRPTRRNQRHRLSRLRVSDMLVVRFTHAVVSLGVLDETTGPPKWKREIRASNIILMPTRMLCGLITTVSRQWRWHDVVDQSCDQQAGGYESGKHQHTCQPLAGRGCMASPSDCTERRSFVGMNPRLNGIFHSRSSANTSTTGIRKELQGKKAL